MAAGATTRKPNPENRGEALAQEIREGIGVPGDYTAPDGVPVETTLKRANLT